MNYKCSAAIGAVSGLRSMTGAAMISRAAGRDLVDLKRTPLAWMSSERASQISALLAGGEMIADKLPFIPNRTDAPSLLVRFVAGALCGASVVSGRETNDRITGALVGGAAAVAASYAGFQYRKHVKLPKLAAAVLEDVVAVSVAAAVVTSLC